MSEEIASFSAMLRSALQERLDPDAETFLDMVAEDVVMEFPFAPPGLVEQLRGREAIRQHLERLGGMLEIDNLNIETVHRTVDPDIFVLEFKGHGQGTATGAPYDQDYISVIRLRDGKIAHYRDYWNPLVVLEALEGSDEAGTPSGIGGRRG